MSHFPNTQSPGSQSRKCEDSGYAENYNTYRENHRRAFLLSLKELIALVRNRQSRCELDEIKKGDIKLLDRVGYFKCLKSLYPSVNISDDRKKGKIHLKGRGQPFENAFDKCFKQLREMNVVEESLRLTLDNKWKWDIVANMHCQEYLKETMMSSDIMAEIKAGNSDNHIIVTALNEIELQKAKKHFNESLIQDVVPVPKCADAFFESFHFQNFKKEQEKNKLLKIFVRQLDDRETAGIQLVGVRDVVAKAKKATENCIGLQREREFELTWTHSTDKFTFLQNRFATLVKPIEDDCQVRIELEDGLQKCKIRWKGLPETSTKCRTSLEDLGKSIWQEDKKIELPGVKQLFNQKDGEQLLQLIQEAKNVSINKNDCRQTTISDSDAQSNPRQQRFVDVPNLMKAKIDPQRSSGNVTLKHGRIEDERAAVLAYSALPNLNDSTVCGQGLKLAGGTAYIEECKHHTNVPPGEVVVTSGGKLECQYVFHVVGCDWKDNKEKNEKVFRSLINKCIQKCIDLCVASLAISSFDAEQHGYTPEDVLEIVKEEERRVYTSNPVQSPLAHVQVVYLKRKHLSRSISSRPIARSSVRERSRTDEHTAEREMSRTKTFGSVSVVLKKGEVTTHKADAIVNILPTDVQRSSYSNVCETIIQAGGQSVKDELNQHIKGNHRQSIFKTRAGSIEEVNEIFHIIPKLPDEQGLQSSLEQCFYNVKVSSVRKVLIPVAEDMSLDVSLECLVQIILDMAKNVGSDYLGTLEIAVLVPQADEFDVLKSLFEERSVAKRTKSADHIRVKHNPRNVLATEEEVFLRQEVETAPVESPNNSPGSVKEDFQIKIPANERDEDNILLRFVGFRSDVNDSISKVMDFVDRNKAKQSIKISNENFHLKHGKDLEIFASKYHVVVTLQPNEITIEGVIKDNVFECHKEITDLLNKHAKIKDEHGKESFTFWLWVGKSKTHQEKFQQFLEYGQKHPEEIKEINGVRFCPSEEFCIGQGSDGTRVYIGLGKDGYEKAVKRVHKDQCGSLAKQEKIILNEPNTAASKHIIKYWYYDDESEKEFAHLILDLCEETLEEYVKRNNREDLLAIAPDIIRQILDGLCDLHQKPTTILHRDLKPSNIMRNEQDRWLLADFGISRTLPPDKNTLVSKQRGNDHWRAVESYSSEESSKESRARYKKESDIQTAGMVAYFIVSKGKHPFGSENERINNLRSGNPVGLSNIEDPALEDLLGWMLSHSPEERPAAKEAKKHPYLQSARERFELLCTIGNVHEIKTGDSTCSVVQQINNDTKDWKKLLGIDVYQYLCLDPKKSTRNKYSTKWTDCLRFIRNANQHWRDPKSIPRPKSIEGEPEDYFVKVFPTLAVRVHRILRSCDWKEREEFKRFFT